LDRKLSLLLGIDIVGSWVGGEAGRKFGMLFWHLHRCARIIFSFKFHLGQMTPQECIDLLVDMVGHECANAESKAQRSMNGDYPPPYQAGYMLGVLQFYQLRKDMVDSGNIGQKVFHDAVAIEVLRALLSGEKLERDFKPTWEFYEMVVWNTKEYMKWLLTNVHFCVENYI
jgi:hypothetical protein